VLGLGRYYPYIRWHTCNSSVVVKVSTAESLGFKALVLIGQSLFDPWQGRPECLWVPLVCDGPPLCSAELRIHGGASVIVYRQRSLNATAVKKLHLAVRSLSANRLQAFVLQQVFCIGVVPANISLLSKVSFRLVLFFPFFSFSRRTETSNYASVGTMAEGGIYNQPRDVPCIHTAHLVRSHTVTGCYYVQIESRGSMLSLTVLPAPHNDGPHIQRWSDNII
jgi:hypothetical protein